MSFQIYGGVPNSLTGPERLPVVFYDASDRRELLPGPLLPDITHRIDIVRADNPAMSMALSDYAFTCGCAEVLRALMTGYALWIDPLADRAPDGIENLLQVEFRRGGLPCASPPNHVLNDQSADMLSHPHHVVYNPHYGSGKEGALCWTSASIVALDGSLVTIYAYVTAPTLPELQHAVDFPIITCQEADALFRAAADGPSARHWVNGPQGLSRRYINPALVHCIYAELTDRDLEQGATAADLKLLTASQNSDSLFALMYVSRLLAPPAPYRPNVNPTGWVELDNIASRIWPAPRSVQQRRKQRAQIYRFLLFGEIACIRGKRLGRYVDRSTGKPIDTEMHSGLWRIVETERARLPLGAELLPDNAPARVNLALSTQWANCITHPNLSQYLPGGEILGSIPGAKATGAWARAIGLALAGFWRRHPRSAFGGPLMPTRLELLTRFEPVAAPPLPLLHGSDPGRALSYWQGALRILADYGWVERAAEVSRSVADQRSELPRYGWQDAWLAEKVEIRPGELLAMTLNCLKTRA